MTPHAFIQFEKKRQKEINYIEIKIRNALFHAKKYQPNPKSLLPASYVDIYPGNVIFFKRESDTQIKDNYGENAILSVKEFPWDWHIIKEIHDPTDLHKAYTADDGCRYGLEGAFVEV